MAKSKKKRKKRAGGSRQRKSGTSKRKARDDKKYVPPEAQDAPLSEGGSSNSGGVLQSMRSGFQRAAGVGEPSQKKESTLSKVLWTVALLAAAGYVIYQYTR